MSKVKKYDIKLKNRVLNISNSLHNHLEYEMNEDYPYINLDYDDDVYDSYFPINVSFNSSTKKKNKGNNKRGCRGSKSLKKNKALNKLRSRFNFDDVDEDYGDNDYKIIYYYRDINNPEDYNEFTNLYEFEEFLNEEGIKVSSFEAVNLMTRCVSHCCVNPSDRLNGELNLITDSSYGSLVYECSECENIC